MYCSLGTVSNLGWDNSAVEFWGTYSRHALCYQSLNLVCRIQGQSFVPSGFSAAVASWWLDGAPTRIPGPFGAIYLPHRSSTASYASLMVC